MLASHGMLAVAFGPKTMAEACAGLPRIRDEADCVELRLDYFEEPYDLPTLLRERGKLRVVATLRPPAEGGRSNLEPAQRLRVLVEAAELGAEFIDLEWDAANPSAQAAVRAAGAQVIVSRHDFSAMPALAEEWWPQLAETGADVVKVVGTARDPIDSLGALQVFERADRPTIAIAMGEAGILTRILALRSQLCLLTYASLEAGGGTAPGQLTVRDMRETFRALRLGPATAVYGLLGPHVERDRLAEYNAWFVDDQIDAVAVPVPTASNAAAIVAAYRELPVSGWHIHGPEFQQDVVSALDDLSPKAQRQGRTNAVVRRGDGSLSGDWVESPREQYEVWCDS